ncbi:MAG: type II toxin-antitoxin system PemK/MazF family toxin [Betaproteobacteria bacterium]|nr:type II toxin-antitoxin system PemK/MazF family toxin [Betaproteobacteria bacterium]
MKCRPGDLVLIPFPYSDLQSSKKRPVLVLTGPDHQGDIIALAVTSVRQRDHALEIVTASLAAGILPRRGWVRVDKIFTLSESAIVKSFGAATPAFMRSVLNGLCERVGYANPYFRLPAAMHRRPPGTYVAATTAGARFKAFVPSPLPNAALLR